MRATSEQQVSVFLANKPGVVADLCAALTERRVNIRGLMVIESVDISTLRMIVDDIQAAQEAFRDAGAAFVVVPVLAVPIGNQPGEFARVARVLANAGINIEYVYATAAPDTERSLGIFRVSDQARALELEFPD